MQADQIGRLRDILEAARLIVSNPKHTTETEFLANSEKQDAVIRLVVVQIEIVVASSPRQMAA